MLALFNRSKKPAEVVSPEFVTGRSFYGFGIHIYKAREGFPAAICGYDNLIYEGSAVDANKIRSSLTNQHDGWYWCPTCASHISGISADEIKEGRK